VRGEKKLSNPIHISFFVPQILFPLAKCSFVVYIGVSTLSEGHGIYPGRPRAEYQFKRIVHFIINVYEQEVMT